MVGKDFAPVLRERARRDRSRVWRARRSLGIPDDLSWGYLASEAVGAVFFLLGMLALMMVPE